MRYVIRCVESLPELVAAFDIMGAQLSRPLSHEGRQFAYLARRFPEDRSMMLVVESEGEIIGGALAFRRGAASDASMDVTLRIIGLLRDHRGQGLGRQLVERIEQAAVDLGAGSVTLGADEAVGFYQHLGYLGKSGMRKQLPLSAAQPHRDPNERRQALDALRARRQARLRN